MNTNVREVGNRNVAFLYEIGIQVLAYHGASIFPAKILKRRMAEGIAEYRIHYEGWNKRWDEWTDQRRLLPNNEKNRRTMNFLKAKSNIQSMEKKKDSEKRKRSRDLLQNSFPLHARLALPTKRRKIAKDSIAAEHKINDSKMEFNVKDKKKEIRDSNKHSLHIKIPIALKKQLIYDWEQITKRGILIRLPKSSNDRCRVCDILKEFVQTAIANGDNKSIVTEIVNGISDFFDQALPVTLLYRAEKEQLKNFRNNVSYAQLKNCELYGAEHLSRLFIKLPKLLNASELDHETLQLLTVTIQNLIRYLVCNSDRYFIKDQRQNHIHSDCSV